MSHSKYSKYIVTDVKRNLELSSHRIEPEEVLSSTRSLPTPVMWLDGNVIPGAFYSEAVWVWPECASERTVAKAPTHPFDEIITEDDQSSPPGAVGAANKLIQESIYLIPMLIAQWRVMENG